MTISWYPGHMHKANKDMASVINSIDVVIEVLDARLPLASANPLLKAMRRDIPCLHVLNKSDLADPVVTTAWIQYFNRHDRSLAVANGKGEYVKKESLIRGCQQLVRGRNSSPGAGMETPRNDNSDRKRYSAMIVGIPNVGKSTILNQILDRKIARTGNEPAVTKARQRVRLNDKWYLSDTPGVLWPKLEDQAAAYRLASTGAIRNTAIEFEDVALFTAELLLCDFPDRLRQRYKLTKLPSRPERLLETLAVEKGCLRKSGQVDWHKISELLINDFRAGKFGRLSLERPPES